MDLRVLSDSRVISELRSRTRRERLRRNLSQTELAKQAGIGFHTLRRFEAGEGEPSLRTFIAILRALNNINALDSILPEPPVDPLDPALGRVERKRASKAKDRTVPGWVWGDEK